MKKRRMVKLAITVVVVFVVGLWVNSRWNVWFGNPEEPAYAPLESPGRVLLTFGDEEELSRNVSWQYDSVVSLNSFVELVDTLAKDTFCIQAEGEEF